MNMYSKTKSQNSTLLSFMLVLLASRRINQGSFVQQTTIPLIQLNNAGPGLGPNGGNATGGTGAGAGQSGRTDGTDDTNEPTDNYSDSQDEADANKQDNYGNTGSNTNDSGTGIGGTDYVGKTTGKTVDESMTDLVDAGSTTDILSSQDGATTSAQTTDAAVPENEDFIENMSGKPIKSGDIGSSNAGKDPSSEGGKYVETPRNADEPRRGTGSGSASNDRGERLDDIDSGTGSAQRGNQAGIDNRDEGIITDL
jgi:hypothetical protein